MAKLTNEQKYKTAEARVKAHEEWCSASNECRRGGVATCRNCFAHWLALEADDEKPEPCPFCGGETSPRHLAGGFCVECDCGYNSSFAETEDAAIAAHNRVARAVRAGKSKKGE